MEKVVVIFDIGKTNKKVLLFNSMFELVYQFEHFIPTVFDEDGYECDDIDTIEKWIKNSIDTLIVENKYEILAINFSTYGASLAYLDNNGERITPIYNYLKPMPTGIVEQIYNKYGGESEFCRLAASPALAMLNSGFQALALKNLKPQLYNKVKNILHFPQYLSYCFTGKITSEYTSIGCHTALWDFDKMDYHTWTSELGNKLPQPIAYNSKFEVNIQNKVINVGIGLHDSSAALVPYLENINEPFILISTGTWCISMNPFNYEPLTNKQIKNDCLSYMSIWGKQVKSSRLFMGHIHDCNAQFIALFFNMPTNSYKQVLYNSDLILKLEDKYKNSVFFENGVPTNYVNNSINLLMFKSYTEAYHKLIIDLTALNIEAIKLILSENDNTQHIFISGGFARNEIYLNLIAKAFPNKSVYTTQVDNASALGAAIVMLGNNTKYKANLGLKKWQNINQTTPQYLL